jgi:hypothetical protein
MNCEVLELPLLTVEQYQLRETLRCAHPALNAASTPVLSGRPFVPPNVHAHWQALVAPYGPPTTRH